MTNEVRKAIVEDIYTYWRDEGYVCEERDPVNDSDYIIAEYDIKQNSNVPKCRGFSIVLDGQTEISSNVKAGSRVVSILSDIVRNMHANPDIKEVNFLLVSNCDELEAQNWNRFLQDTYNYLCSFRRVMNIAPSFSVLQFSNSYAVLVKFTVTAA